MTVFPALTGKQIIRVLKNLDFIEIRIKGSHHFLKHSDGRSTFIPVHSKEIIGKGLLAKNFTRL